MLVSNQEKSLSLVAEKTSASASNQAGIRI
jgi:hypothetical protein